MEAADVQKDMVVAELDRTLEGFDRLFAFAVIHQVAAEQACGLGQTLPLRLS